MTTSRNVLYYFSAKNLSVGRAVCRNFARVGVNLGYYLKKKRKNTVNLFGNFNVGGSRLDQGGANSPSTPAPLNIPMSRGCREGILLVLVRGRGLVLLEI